MSNKEITRVPEILPDNLAAESVEFVTFLKKYYEWMGREGNPSADIDRSLSQRTLENAVDFYISSLYNELGHGFVLNKSANQQNILNNLSEIYSAKGSLQSIKVMFRALFGEEIDIKLPKEQILKSSSGNWLSEYSVIVELNQGDPYTMVGKYVEVETSFPNTPTQTFDVEVKRVEQREEGTNVYEVYVSRYFAGFFYFNSVIKYGYVRATLKPSMSKIVNIEEDGTGFRVGETFPINDYIRQTGFQNQAKLPNSFKRRVYSKSGLRRVDIEDVDVDVRSDGTITQTIRLGNIVTTRILRGNVAITRVDTNGVVREFKETLDGIPTPNLEINWDAIAAALTELADFAGLDGTLSIFLYHFLIDTPTATYVDGTTDPLFDTTGGATQYARGDFDRDGALSIDDATSVIRYLFDVNPTFHAGDTDRFDRITDVIAAWNAYTTANGLPEYAFDLRVPNTSGDSWDPMYSIPIEVGVDLLKLSVDLDATPLTTQRTQLNEIAGSTQYKKGDIDNDGVIDTDDLITIIKYQDPNLRTTLSAGEIEWITAFLDVGTPAELDLMVSAMALEYQSGKRNALHDFLLQTDGDYATGRVRGDINQNGAITLDDVTLLLRRASGYYDIDRGGVEKVEVTELVGGYVPNTGQITLSSVGDGDGATITPTIRDGVITKFDTIQPGYGLRSAIGILRVFDNSTITNVPDDWQFIDLSGGVSYYRINLSITNGKINTLASPGLMYNFPEEPLTSIIPDYDDAKLEPILVNDGKILSVDTVIGANGSRVAGTYNISSGFTTSGSGTGGAFTLNVDSNGAVEVINWDQFGQEYVAGGNLITNGEFPNNADGWALGSNFTWDSSGRVERTSGTGNSYFGQSINIVAGKTYRVRYDVEHTGGNNTTNQYSAWTGVNANHGTSLNGSGSVDVNITATVTGSMTFRLYGIGDFRGYYDNIRIEEVSTVGSNYAVGETITIPDSLVGNGGAPAVTFDVAELTDSHRITGANIIEGGTGYFPDNVFISVQDGTGSEAAFPSKRVYGTTTPAVGIKNGVIDKVYVTEGGSGYTDAGTSLSVTRAGVTVTGAVLNPVITNGSIASVTIVNGGEDYDPDTDIIVITGDGTQANISGFEIIDGVIDAVALPFSQGGGYSSNTRLVTTAGLYSRSVYDKLDTRPELPRIQPIVQDGVITEIDVDRQGINYSDNTVLANTIQRDTPELKAVTDSNGSIVSVVDSSENTIRALSGWQTATITVTDLAAEAETSSGAGDAIGGTGASITADIDQGKISGFVIGNSGSGYIEPQITLTGTRKDAVTTVHITPDYVEWIDEVIGEPLLGSVYNPLLLDGPGVGANARVTKVGPNGELQGIKLTSFGFDFPETFTTTVTPENPAGTLSQITFSSVVVGVTSSSYVDRKGFLSDIIKIQDNDLYQEFSYIVQTGVDFDIFEDLIKKSVHPAGMKIFGEQSINSFFSLGAQQFDQTSFFYTRQLFDRTDNGELDFGGDGTSTRNEDDDVFHMDKDLPRQEDLTDSTADAEHNKEIYIMEKDMGAQTIHGQVADAESGKEIYYMQKDMTPGSDLDQVADAEDGKEVYFMDKDLPRVEDPTDSTADAEHNKEIYHMEKDMGLQSAHFQVADAEHNKEIYHMEKDMGLESTHFQVADAESGKEIYHMEKDMGLQSTHFQVADAEDGKEVYHMEKDMGLQSSHFQVADAEDGKEIYVMDKDLPRVEDPTDSTADAEHAKEIYHMEKDMGLESTHFQVADAEDGKEIYLMGKDLPRLEDPTDSTADAEHNKEIYHMQKAMTPGSDLDQIVDASHTKEIYIMDKDLPRQEDLTDSTADAEHTKEIYLLEKAMTPGSGHDEVADAGHNKEIYTLGKDLPRLEDPTDSTADAEHTKEIYLMGKDLPRLEDPTDSTADAEHNKEIYRLRKDLPRLEDPEDSTADAEHNKEIYTLDKDLPRQEDLTDSTADAEHNKEIYTLEKDLTVEDHAEDNIAYALSNKETYIIEKAMTPGSNLDQIVTIGHNKESYLIDKDFPRQEDLTDSTVDISESLGALYHKRPLDTSVGGLLSEFVDDLTDVDTLLFTKRLTDSAGVTDDTTLVDDDIYSIQKTFGETIGLAENIGDLVLVKGPSDTALVSFDEELDVDFTFTKVLASSTTGITDEITNISSVYRAFIPDDDQFSDGDNEAEVDDDSATLVSKAPFIESINNLNDAYASLLIKRFTENVNQVGDGDVVSSKLFRTLSSSITNVEDGDNDILLVTKSLASSTQNVEDGDDNLRHIFTKRLNSATSGITDVTTLVDSDIYSINKGIQDQVSNVANGDSGSVVFTRNYVDIGYIANGLDYEYASDVTGQSF